MQAAMSYLRVLREANDLSQEDVARAADVTVKQVGRWERGESEPGGSGLVAFADLVHGSMEDVKRLILNKKATDETGQQLAEKTLAALRGATDEHERRQVLDRLIAELEYDPRKIDQLIGYGACLRDEDRAAR